MLPRALCLLLCGALASGGCGRKSGANGSGPLKVAAAASLARAFEDVARAFTEKTGRAVTLSTGSSGKLSAQLAEGAPYDVFASASEKYVDEVIAEGAAIADTRTIYAYGRVVAWTRADVAPMANLADLAQPRFTKIALANPDHAPYGHAAREALQSAGLWQQIEPRIVYGTNVGQALQFGETGNADVSLTALSLVMGGAGKYTLVDDSGHEPLGQVVVVVKGTDKEKDARAFVEFLASPAGHAILERYGLLQKGQSLPAP